MKKLETIEVSLQEIWAATRPSKTKNKKKYNRKNKRDDKEHDFKD